MVKPCLLVEIHYTGHVSAVESSSKLSVTWAGIRSEPERTGRGTPKRVTLRIGSRAKEIPSSV